MSDQLDGREIGSTAWPHCALCGSFGYTVYEKLSDRLFGSSGLWALKRCPRADCGLFWLDPMPLPAEIGKAYAGYYTHSASNHKPQTGLLRRIYQHVTESYLARYYGYEGVDGRGFAPVFARAMYLLPLRRHETDAWIGSLKSVPNGKLLDVGCGAGDWLLAMQYLGWTVEGTDLDPAAVATARGRGLTTVLGTLEECAFPDEHFDAVTLHHVLEHVPDPVLTLSECRRILKRGGKLVIATPNGASLSHRLFKNSWRGLEPPRHLHLFSTTSLSRALGLAGFDRTCIRPIVATSVINESLSLFLSSRNLGFRGQSTVIPRLSRVLTALELIFASWSASIADCVGAVAVKD